MAQASRLLYSGGLRVRKVQSFSGALNKLLADERFDAPRELFDDRQCHELRLLDAAAQASHLVYEYLNPVAAGLVDRPGHMPFRAVDWHLWKSGYIEVKRPPIYFDARNRPDVRRLYVTPPPLLYKAFDGDLDALVHRLDRLSEHARQNVRAVRRGRPVMGAKALRRVHPWSEPRTLRESGGKQSKTFRVGADNILAIETKVGAAGETTRFRERHRAVRLARRDGDLERVYPYGTYAARVHRGAPVQAEPDVDAILAKPGPTLDEVKEELASSGGGSARAERNLMLDEVRGALADEAPALVEHDDMELCRKVPIETSEVEPGDVEVRHRFDPKPQKRSAAKRIVTLRDRRRGRHRRSERNGTVSVPQPEPERPRGALEAQHRRAPYTRVRRLRSRAARQGWSR